MHDQKIELETIVDDYFSLNDCLYSNQIFDAADNHIDSELNLAFYDQDNREYIENGYKNLIKFIDRDETDRGFDIAGIKEVLSDIVNFSPKMTCDDSLSMFYKYLLLKVSFVEVVNEKKSKIKYKRETFTLRDFEELNFFKTHAYWFFRGQQNSEWRLIPTCLRTLKENIIFDHDYYISRLEKSGLNSKYREEIKFRSDESEYYQYAFIQHTCSFSPMIDFTREECIAGAFALRKRATTDSKIYMLSFDNDDLVICDEREAGRILCDDTEIYYVNSEKIRLGQTISFHNSKKTIELIKIDSIIELLTPKPTIIQVPTNDRMRKQKGVFLVFRNCLALKGVIHFELCEDLVMQEFIIPTNQKGKFRKKLQQNFSQFSWESLMNPYLGFEKISV